MSNYGLVFQDRENNRLMLCEFVEEGTDTELYAIQDTKYDALPDTMFAVVDIQRRGNGVDLMDLHQFEMFRPDGSADQAMLVIRSILGMEDGGKTMFKAIFDQIVEELFSGTVQ